MRATRHVLRWDPYLEPDEDDMEFRLTYDGPLLAFRDDSTRFERALHVHDIRKRFHKQLAVLWREHPVLSAMGHPKREYGDVLQFIDGHNFEWLPIVNKDNGLICRLDILMLREGQPGRALYDIDNRLKTVFDALRLADTPTELGAKSSKGQQVPGPDETPFYVLLQNDNLITHVAVTTDTLLEPVSNVPKDQAVRLVIGVTIRPYKSTMDNADFA